MQVEHTVHIAQFRARAELHIEAASHDFAVELSGDSIYENQAKENANHSGHLSTVMVNFNPIKA